MASIGVVAQPPRLKVLIARIAILDVLDLIFFAWNASPEL